MGSRREAREFCLQCLYLWDNCSIESQETLLKIVNTNHNPEVLNFGKKLLGEFLADPTTIDAMIEKYSLNWKMNRMATIDRNILRLGACELLRFAETPTKVVINEAVEIAKKYSTEESGKFVNGILDKIAKLRPKEPRHEPSSPQV